nr:immunoglobulin light chain junction region [Macaca mulatta]MOX77529.1 immunoglobulin light chain junction region [Macaca mulatta]MOX77554.1 immunoglobulin light chain junction region [Macaca mulatta]MOX77572.1 immunoglobulin light chain junction region [Macaca mulatta]MOX77642.1 immunoglobulin light chain junction region [Macaca mulatta]
EYYCWLHYSGAHWVF